MANPNIVGVTAIYGKTAVAALTVTTADIIENTAASGKIFKINSIHVSNIDGTDAADLTITFYNADNATSYHLLKDLSVPSNSTLLAIEKDATIYLEEGDKIAAYAGAASDLEILISYEEIS